MSSLKRSFTSRRQSSINVKPEQPAANGNHVNSEEHQSTMAKTLGEFRDAIKKGLPMDILNPELLSGVVDVIRHGTAIDDRKMLLEHALVILAKLPQDLPVYQTLMNDVTTLLYNDLAHPPATYVSNEFAWRTADGSQNNVSVPGLGAAKTAYARTVQQQQALPDTILPDPGLVFDVLLKREKFTPHPAGLSSLMFAFAALVIHSVFRTSHKNWTINDTSSYVDLAPLYGNDAEKQSSVRLHDGRGLLHPDVFAEDRLLLLPPAVPALLVLFNRNHNYIAQKLLAINERNTWADPSTIPSSDPERPAKLKQQDEEIFQTARLCNCGWFANIVFSDYFSTILGLVRDGSSWTLQPFQEIRKSDHSFLDRGVGNACSVEFNCLYRWHATTSAADEQWVQGLFAKFFPGKSFEEVTADDFMAMAKQAQASEPDLDHWTIGQLQRQSDGSFKSDDLAKLIMDATSQPAHAFGARGTPHVMRLNEIMGIMQSRRWGVCSLNDFRRYLGLKTYSTFLEWNSDPEIADAASKLYGGDINNLELYVGLQAEETKPVIEGAGLCPGYTISRAILADAISLTRGDRFYTSDFTPHNYTAWGFKDCQRDDANPAFGGMLGRLFLRTLPGEYTSDSVYTWFPLMTPAAMENITANLGLRSRYEIVRPTRAPEVTLVAKYAQVKAIMEDPTGFRPPYADRVGSVVKGQGFFIVHEQGNADQRLVRDILFGTPGGMEQIAQVYATRTQEVLARESYFLSGRKIKSVDITEVLRRVPIWWALGDIAGLSIKTADNPDGHFTEPQLYSMLADIYSYIFLEIDASHELRLEESAKTHADELLAKIKGNVRGSGGSRLSFFGLFQNMMSNPSSSRRATHEFVTKLAASGKSVDELGNAILSLAIGSTVELSQAMLNMVNMYLEPANVKHLEEIRKLAVSTSPDAEATLQGYAREAIRLDPPFAGIYREARSTQTVAELSVQNNAKLFLSIFKANRDATFKDADIIDPTRPVELYITGGAVTKTLGNDFMYKVLGQALRAVFSLKNVRRAPGQSGVLKRFPLDVNGTEYYQYLNAKSDPTPWATSMVLQYDA